MPAPIENRIAAELAVRPQQVLATITLLDEGATVPFIARYRKEVTDGLDDTQLRNLAERLEYLRDLDKRRLSILEAIGEQGKLTPALAAQIDGADSKQRLEDLYAPYKLKRRTKAQIAKEAGLDVLADLLYREPARDPETEAQAFLKPAFTTDAGDNPGVADVKAALEGARHVLMERFSEDANLLGRIREALQCARRGRVEGRRRQAGGGREVRRLLRLPGAAEGHPVASRPGALAGPARRGAGDQPENARGPGAGREFHADGWVGVEGWLGVQVTGGATGLLRADDRVPLRHRGPGTAGRCLAAPDGTLDLAGEAVLADGDRTDRRVA